MRKLFIALAIIGTFYSCQRADLEYLNETLYVHNDGAEMPVYVRGNGASKCIVLIVHGGPGGNGLEYSVGLSQEILEEKYAFAYWDQRGQGMAQGHYSVADLNMDQMVSDLRAVILTIREHYGESIKVFVLGHSWGGTISGAYIIDPENQALIAGWIEVDGAHDNPRLSIEAIKMFRQIGEEQLGLGNSSEKWSEILDWANTIDTNNITYDQTGEINSYAWEAEGLMTDNGYLSDGDGGSLPMIGPTNQLTSLIMGNYTNDVISPEAETVAMNEKLPLVTVPCLFLWGKYDFIVPPQLGVDAYNLVSSTDKELVIFNESGHSPMVNEPELYAAEVIEFIDRNK